MADFINVSSSLKVYLQKDKRYLRLKDSLSTLPVFNLDVDSIYSEIKMADSMRKVKKLKSTAPDFVDRIIAAALNDQNIRSRMTEILTETVRTRRSLEVALESFTSYALLRYADTLSIFKTKGEKEGAINFFFSDAYKYLADICMLQDVVTKVVEDIDKAHWTLKTIVDALKMIHTPEGRI
jgi:hypothetical protein